MSAFASVTPALLDAVFGLPDGVHIVRVDRVPTAGGPGRFVFRLVLGGPGLLLEGDIYMTQSIIDNVVSTELHQLDAPADMEPAPPQDQQRRRTDGAQHLAEAASRLRELP